MANSYNKEESDNIFSTLIVPETPASIESYIDNVKILSFLFGLIEQTQRIQGI